MTKKMLMTMAGIRVPGMKVAVGITAGNPETGLLTVKALELYKGLSRLLQRGEFPADAETPERVAIFFDDDVEEDEEEDDDDDLFWEEEDDNDEEE